MGNSIYSLHNNSINSEILAAIAILPYEPQNSHEIQLEVGDEVQLDRGNFWADHEHGEYVHGTSVRNGWGIIPRHCLQFIEDSRVHTSIEIENPTTSTSV